MRILLIGGGGREHALAWKLAQSPSVTRLYAAPGNPGIAQWAECVRLKDSDTELLVALAARERIDLTVVGPELPLSMGLVDRFRDAGLRIFGPTQAAARLESSKVFAKDLMFRHGIPTARYSSFTDGVAARRYCRELGAPLVVKADGLAAGKGAVVCHTLEEADRAVALCLEQRGFGEAGRTIVVEEFMRGEEMSFFVLSDGTTPLPFGAAQDHKTIFDGDCGPNTGGMGAYSPAPVFDETVEQRVMKEIVVPTIQAMKQEGAPYQGVLYVGLMMTQEGPKVVEFNCRFGDPECQVIVPRYPDDLVPLFKAVADGDGLPHALTWQADASVCVVLASAGYPGRYETGRPIQGVAQAEREAGVNVFHAGTALRDGSLVTAGGRVLGVQAVGKDLAEATARAYAAVARITFEGMQFRKDIGRKALARR